MDSGDKQIYSILHMINLFNNKIYGRTFFQKFFYLLDEEGNLDLFKDFQPYYYGPYSEQLNFQVSNMVEEGFLEEEKIKTKKHECYVYSLTKKGKKLLEGGKNNIEPKTKNTIERYQREFSGFNAIELLRYVYKKHPESAVNSKFKG